MSRISPLSTSATSSPQNPAAADLGIEIPPGVQIAPAEGFYGTVGFYDVTSNGKTECLTRDEVESRFRSSTLGSTAMFLSAVAHPFTPPTAVRGDTYDPAPTAAVPDPVATGGADRLLDRYGAVHGFHPTVLYSGTANGSPNGQAAAVQPASCPAPNMKVQTPVGVVEPFVVGVEHKKTEPAQPKAESRVIKGTAGDAVVGTGLGENV